MKRLAVFFPGIGYTVDKPLMHYSRRLAAQSGFEVKLLPYAGFPEKIRGDREKMEESYLIARQQAEEMMRDADLASYDDILFIGKSIGTIVAAEMAANSPERDRIRLVLYTPIEDTFSFLVGNAVVFTGSKDPWVKGPDSIPALCEQSGIPCVIIEGGNHSLESGDVLKDLKAMKKIMERTQQFMDE